jgi:hypothetical protein
MQHRHLVGDARDELHVVLDDDHRTVPADALEQLGGLLALLGAHAGHRLVEHQQLRLLHQQHADLQPLLLAMAQQGRLHLEVLLQPISSATFVHPPPPPRHSRLEGQTQPNTVRPADKETSRFSKTVRFS